MVGSDGYMNDVDLITKQIKKLSVHRKKRKNKNYDESYFPRATPVVAYANQSSDRAFWLRHPNEEHLKWCIHLRPKTKQFEKVVSPLKKAFGYNIQILNVFKVSNKFLMRQYQLKKKQKELQYNCIEYTMYHYTTEDKIAGIVRNNFNWRFSGESRGHKYGYGVCFSGDCGFAEQFCKDKKQKVMLVVSVLVTVTQVGNPDMKLPDAGFDTTVSPKKTVYVKFEDSEFYPEYAVIYKKKRYI